MDRDHVGHVQRGLLSFHTPWNSQGRTRKVQGGLGAPVELKFNYMPPVDLTSL